MRKSKSTSEGVVSVLSLESTWLKVHKWCLVWQPTAHPPQWEKKNWKRQYQVCAQVVGVKVSRVWWCLPKPNTHLPFDQQFHSLGYTQMCFEEMYEKIHSTRLTPSGKYPVWGIVTQWKADRNENEGTIPMCNMDVTNMVLGKKKANTQYVLPRWIEMGKGNPGCQRSEKGKLSEGMAWQEKSLRGAPGGAKCLVSWSEYWLYWCVHFV